MTAAGALLPFASARPSAPRPKVQPQTKRIVSIFTKQLQWLNYEELAGAAIEMGFDGVELTVREKGHVLPENVERDLPRAVDCIRKVGLQAIMIVTDIAKASDPYAEKVLKTASELGIQYYRTAYMEYDFTRSIDANLKSFEAQLKELADMNRHFRIRGACQNHRGMHFSSPLWDLWLVLKEIHSEWLGSQFDILHATVEGTNTWPMILRGLAPYVNTVVVKDFYWHKDDGKWKFDYCPIGEGLVTIKSFFDLLNELNIYVPISMQCEYDLGIPNDLSQMTAVQKTHVLEQMKKDLTRLRPMI